MLRNPIPTGTKYGELTVIRPTRTDDRGRTYYLCHCSCGTQTEVRVDALKSGSTTSCGALVHHPALSREYPVAYSRYCGARRRCTDKRSKDWKNYGGRGVKFRFDTFPPFLRALQAVGWDESGGPGDTTHLTVERKNNDGDYAPGNLALKSRAEQARNTRRTRRLTVGDTTASYSDWADWAGLAGPETIADRLAMGWTPAEAVGVPAGTSRAAYHNQFNK